MARRRDRGLERRIANERVLQLHDEALQAALRGERDLAARYAGLGRRIGMRYLVGTPATLGRRLCGPCGAYLLPGRTARVRCTGGKVSWTCLGCGDVQRVPWHRERAARRRGEAA